MVRRPAISALPLMLALTFSTGVADAVGYLGLDKVFTGNMTGNVVILGMAVGGAADLPVVGPLIGLCGYIAGAAVGGAVLRRSPHGWSSRVSALLFVLALVLGGLCVAAAADVWAYLVTGGLAATMGLQASIARHLAVKDVTTVVVTSTLTALASSWPGDSKHWRRRSAAIGLLLVGAVAGALLVQMHIAAGIAVSAAITAGVAVIGHLCVRTTVEGS